MSEFPVREESVDNHPKVADSSRTGRQLPVRKRKMRHAPSGRKYTAVSCEYCGYLPGDNRVPDCGSDAPPAKGALKKPCGLYRHGHVSMADLFWSVENARLQQITSLL